MTASHASPLRNGEPSGSDDSRAALHRHRRIFIGPLPEKLLSQTEAYARKRHHKDIFLGRTSAPDGASNGVGHISQIIKDHAYEFFVREGGRREDWSAEEERSKAEALLHKWNQSEWGTIWHRRKQRRGEVRDAPYSRWVGGSFEVGDMFDVSVLDDLPSVDVSAQEEPVFDVPTSPRGPQNGNGQSDVLVKTDGLFMTVSSGPQQVLSSPASSMKALSPATSHTGLLDRSSHLKSASSLDLGRTQGTEAHLSRISKGKSQKRVRYNEESQDNLSPHPAPPTEVLSRTQQTVDANTSAAATVSFAPGTQLGDSSTIKADVILRGMCVEFPFAWYKATFY
jgi:hypothetical protein